MHIANLRRKIEPERGAPRFIRTDPGVGYRFAAEPARLHEIFMARGRDLHSALTAARTMLAHGIHPLAPTARSGRVSGAARARQRVARAPPGARREPPRPALELSAARSSLAPAPRVSPARVPGDAAEEPARRRAAAVPIRRASPRRASASSLAWPLLATPTSGSSARRRAVERCSPTAARRFASHAPEARSMSAVATRARAAPRRWIDLSRRSSALALRSRCCSCSLEGPASAYERRRARRAARSARWSSPT